MPTDYQALLGLDTDHVWHPYASAVDPAPVWPVESAHGVMLRLADGRELVDGMSSWWAAIHGYRVPELDRAATDQLGRMSHVMFGGLTHAPAVDLAMRLLRITPGRLAKVFFSDSGSVAVEVAIKMAIQYWVGRGEPRRTKLLTVRGGYHGDTFGAMSVCDPVSGMHGLFRGVLAEQYFAPLPTPDFGEAWNDAHVGELAGLLKQHDDVAAVILEPVVQGAGGMRFYAPEYLRRVRELCSDHGVLLILDEIATGFGRTGKLFAAEWAEVSPDILCLGKALTGGYSSLAATLTTEEVAEGVSAAAPGLLMHGPTFMGNPLACSIALSSIDLLLASPWQDRVKRIEAQLIRELEPCRALAPVRDVRVLGAIGVIETKEPIDVRRLQPALVDRGVWLRPFGRLLYTMPPFVIPEESLSKVTAAMFDVLRTS